MNICFVCNEYPDGPHGGVGTMNQLLAEELVLGKHAVKVIGIYDKQYPSPGFEIKNGVEVTRIKINYQNKISVLWAYLVLSKKIKQWINNNMVDIIESPDSYGMFSFVARFKKPLVLRAHGNQTYFSSILNTPLKKRTLFYESNLYKKASGICAVSEFTAEKMKTLFNVKKSITVIHNGIYIQKVDPGNIDLTDNLAGPHSLSNIIIFSGTLTPKKGIYELIKAVVILLKKGLDLTLIVNGKDTVNSATGHPVKNDLMKLIPLELQKNIIFNGHISREELLYQYKYCKAAVFPSYAEAFAIAPMEAMAAGIPTIYSHRCSGAELISDKEDGLLIDPSSELSIARAIEYILKYPEEAKLMGQKGKEKIEKSFSKETMTTKTLLFYEQVQAAFYK